MIRKFILTGKSCTGKTATSVALAARLGCRRFSSGEELKEISKLRGLKSHRELAVDAYLGVDATAKKLLLKSDSIVVEGRYVGSLAAQCGDVFLVMLICSEEVREIRLSQKRIATHSYDVFSENQITSALYRSETLRSGSPNLVVDTSYKSPETVADEILARAYREEA